jgi:hypothetical protein
MLVALAAIPCLLTLLLAASVFMGKGRFGELSNEIFMLGPLPIVALTALVLTMIFTPFFLWASRFTKGSFWSAIVIGFLSALLPVLLGMWSVFADPRLRLGAKLERLGDQYPWLIMGGLGGLLFWLFVVFRNDAFQRVGKDHL